VRASFHEGNRGAGLNNGAAVTIGCGPIPWAGPGGHIGVRIGTIGIGPGTFGWKAPGSGVPSSLREFNNVDVANAVGIVDVVVDVVGQPE
jgi:hypothetical protein